MEFNNKEQVLEYAEKRRMVTAAVKRIIVNQLCLDIEPEFITNDQPLFGRGLELDSIDALELAVGIFSDFSVNSEVFSSVNTISDYIMSQEYDDSNLEPVD